MRHTIVERDWERFDGFTPTFTHPSLSSEELQLLLGSAYTRFYVRPSFLANYLRISTPLLHRVVRSLDRRVGQRHARQQEALIAREAAW
jgi:hypothetical protein